MTDVQEAREADVLAAIDRLVHRHRVLTIEQAKLAARLVTGSDAAFVAPREATIPGHNGGSERL